MIDSITMGDRQISVEDLDAEGKALVKGLEQLQVEADKWRFELAKTEALFQVVQQSLAKHLAPKVEADSEGGEV